MPSGIDDLSIIIRERELTPIKEQEILSYLTRELGVDEVEIEHGLSILMIVGENMKDHIGVTATAAKALSEKHINLEMISQGSSEVSVMFVIETEQEKAAVRALYDAFSVVMTNLKTYLLQGKGFFFMRKTKPALIISTPIANSLINYA